MQMHGHIFKLETKWTWCAELVGSKVSILPSRNFRVCCRNMSEKKFPARAPMVSNSGPSAHINISPTDQTCSDPVSPRIFWSSSQDSSMPTPLAVPLVVLALELLVANGSWWKLWLYRWPRCQMMSGLKTKDKETTKEIQGSIKIVRKRQNSLEFNRCPNIL